MSVGLSDEGDVEEILGTKALVSERDLPARETPSRLASMWNLVGRVMGQSADVTARMEPRNYNKYGWRPDALDYRDKMYKFSASAGDLPRQVDLRTSENKHLGIFHQGKLGSCTANAIAAAFEFDQHKQHVAEFVPSRLFIYYNERCVEGTVFMDSGAQLRDGIKVMHRLGCCPEEMWPYEIEMYQTRPAEECYEVAAAHTAQAYQRVQQDVMHLKSCIAEGFPFVFGFIVCQSFESKQVATSGKMPMPTNSDRPLGGHAVIAVGYDDSQEVFIVRNSWGSKWGQRGYFMMPYDYIRNKMLAQDFWTIRWV